MNIKLRIIILWNGFLGHLRVFEKPQIFNIEIRDVILAYFWYTSTSKSRFVFYHFVSSASESNFDIFAYLTSASTSTSNTYHKTSESTSSVHFLHININIYVCIVHLIHKENYCILFPL